MAFRLTHRHRWPRNPSELLQVLHCFRYFNVSDTPPFAAFGSSYRNCLSLQGKTGNKKRPTTGRCGEINSVSSCRTAALTRLIRGL